MKKTVFIRTIKTVVATISAIVVAQALGLEYATAAGIIAILNVFDTRRATLEGSLKRALSAVVALTIGGVCFELFGYTNWIFGLYLLIFVPVSFLLKVELGLGPSSVIVTHILAAQTINSGLILNELALVFIGTGFAMLTNFYAPNEEKRLQALIEKVDEEMKDILNLFARSLTEDLDVQEYDHLFKELEDNLEKAVKLAVLEDENMNQDSSLVLYGLNIRRQEMDLLREMYEDLSEIPPSYANGLQMSYMLKTTSTQLTEEGAIHAVQKRIYYLKENAEKLPLPKTAEEFVIRSAIYQVFKNLDRFTKLNAYITDKPMGEPSEKIW